MKNSLISNLLAIIGVAVSLFSGSAQATVIGFEDVSIGGSGYAHPVAGYQGFQWSGNQGSTSWVISNNNGSFGSIGANAHTGNNFAWSNGGAALDLSSAIFDLNSVWLASWAGNQTETIKGYLAGNEIYSTTLTVGSNYSFVSLDFVGVDQVTFSGGFNLVLDDMTINGGTVPEPESLALFGLALAGLGLTRRKAKHA